MADVAHGNGMVRDHVSQLATLASQTKRNDTRLGEHDVKIDMLSGAVISIDERLKTNRSAVLAGVAIGCLALAVLQIVLHIVGGG